jgi:hypothetical protein
VIFKYGIGISLDFVTINHPEWWSYKDGIMVKQFLNLVSKSEFIEIAKYYGIDGSSRKKKINKSIYDFFESSKKWKPIQSYALAMYKDEPSDSFSFRIDPGYCQFKIAINESIGENFYETFLDKTLKFVYDLYDLWKDEIVFFRGSSICCPGITYLRQFPPREISNWGKHDIVEIIDKRFYYKHLERRPDLKEFYKVEDMEKLISAPLPYGVERFEHGDLVILRWVRDLTDESKIAHQLMLHEKWLCDNIDFPIESGYNEFGDKKIGPIQGEYNRPPLTIYRPTSGIGYKTLLVNPDGTIDNEVVEELKKIISTKQLPDGTEVKKVRTISPDRKTAVELRDRLQDVGIEKFLYVDNEKSLWDPFAPMPE